MNIFPKLVNTAQKTYLKTGKSIKRYMLKNTVSGSYERHIDAATWLGTAAVFNSVSNPSSAMLNSSLFMMTGYNIVGAIADRIKLRPIKKKAKAIRKATKIAKKNAKKLTQEQGQNTIIQKTFNKPKQILKSIKDKLLKG